MFFHSSQSVKTLAALCVLTTLILQALTPVALVFAEETSGTETTPPPTEVVEEEEAATEETITEEMLTEEGDQGEEEGNLETEESFVEPLEEQPLITESESASSSPEILDTGTTTVETTQDALITNVASSTASTGGNTASSSEDALIVTGDATAVANVVTAVNVNVYNSSGLLLFLTNLLGGLGSIDFRDFGFMSPTQEQTGSTCSLSECPEGNLVSITTESNATVDNSVSVSASTGSNTAGGSDATIVTGDAYAAANLVTVANTSFVDSSYVMLVMNNFGSWNEDVIFPSAGIFGELFGSFSGGGSALGSVDTEQNATVNTSVSVGASTGSNTATSSESGSTIITGDAQAGATVVNEVNGSFINSDAFVVIFRIHGTWSGSLFGLPEGVSWEETSDGIVLYGTPEEDGGTSGGGLFSGITQQNATVNNAVEVYALTGNNEASGDESTIVTGDATAAANVVTLANNQVVGRNWLFAIINIFGDWGGDISFGQPDLWVGGLVDAPQQPLDPDRSANYHLTVANYGDTAAKEVRLTVRPSSYMSVSDFGAGVLSEQGVIWNLGDIAPGGVKEVTFDGGANMQVLPTGRTTLSLEAEVSSAQRDANTGDNIESLAIDVQYGSSKKRKMAEDLQNSARGAELPELSLEKTLLSGSLLQPGDIARYKVRIYNSSAGPAYDAILTDTLHNPEGEVVFEEVWEIGDIASGEEIIVEYDVSFASSSESGLYTNTARARALGGARWSEPFLGHYIISNEASVPVYVSTSDVLSQNTISTDTDLLGLGTTTLSGSSTPLVLSSLRGDDGGLNAGQLAGLGILGDLQSVLWLLPLIILAAIGYYLIRDEREVSVVWRRRYEGTLEFLRSHNLFFW